MFSQHRKEPCGRHIQKPEAKTLKDEIELYEEAEPIQQKIENLRTKIALQERYNTALKDNLEESDTGNYSVLQALFNDVNNLRISLREAVGKEKAAVNNALRTHRLFQLALKGCTPHQAINWMDDKLFDNAKILNEHLDRLIQKRKRLEGMERAVEILEKWPIPGSLPWEVTIEEQKKKVSVDQANMEMKLECAKTLGVKYKAIRGRLRDERNMYEPILRNLSSQLTLQQSELKKLEQMLSYAKKFQQAAEVTLESTEKEAHTSRKLRRAHMGRMRKEMKRLVEEEQLSLSMQSKTDYSHVGGGRSGKDLMTEGFLINESALIIEENEETKLNERLAKKRAVIETFNDNAALLVDAMKIPNLIHIPKRMETVINLTESLKQETTFKEKLKNHLIKQRDQLSQLLCVIKYTGESHVSHFNHVIEDYHKSLVDSQRETALDKEAVNQDLELMVDVQMGITALMQRIEGLDRKQLCIKNTGDLMKILPIFYERLEELIQSYKQLKREVPTSSLAAVGRRATHYRLAEVARLVPPKFVRVGDPLEADEESEKEEFEDFKVPGRHEIKLQSEKIFEQAKLRIGLAGGGKKKHTLVSRRRTESMSISTSTFDGIGAPPVSEQLPTAQELQSSSSLVGVTTQLPEEHQPDENRTDIDYFVE